MQVREPDRVNQKIDPSTCSVMDGHQHDPTGIEALADSIVTLGQLHPSLIIEYLDGRRLIAAGRRRWMACKLRKIPLVANVWCCDEAEDTNLEMFANAIRVAENLERRDPSAMDIAMQLRAIRSQHGFNNARELGESIGMSESRVKKYMSIFGASDYLQEIAKTHNIPLKPMLELAKLEKSIGERSTRRHITGFIKNEISTADLMKVRTKPQRKERSKTPSDPLVALRKSGEHILSACEAAPEDAREYVAALVEELQRFLDPEAFGVAS